MGKITAIVSDDIENSLRDFVRGKGDISRIVEEALQLWLNKQKGEKSG